MTVGLSTTRFALSLEVFSSTPARRALPQVRFVGYSGVGLPAWRKDLHPAALGSSGARDLNAVLARSGLAISWLGCGARGLFTVGASLDEDIDFASWVVRMAGEVRAEAVVARLGEMGEEGSQAAANVAEALGVLTPMADDAGTSLAVAAARGEAKLVSAILAGFPGAPVGVMLDPGKALFEGRDPVGAISAAPGICAVRASDSSADEVDLPPGKGRVAWRDFLAGLGVFDYHGFVTVDFAPRAGGPAEAAAASALEFLRKSSF